MTVLKFIDDASKREFVFGDFKMQPLEFSHLQELTGKRGGPVSFPLSVRGARELAADGTLGEERFSVDAALSAPYSLQVLALVDGGWLPAGLLPQECLLLLDRCALTFIKGRYQAGAAPQEGPGDFLDLLTDRVVRVNPIPLMLEGNLARLPASVQELETQYDEAHAAIRRALPSADVTPDRRSAVQGATGLLVETRERYNRERSFLKTVCPGLGTSVGVLQKVARWNHILEVAAAHRLRVASPVVICALSCAVAAQSCNPARTLLKARTAYRDCHAHNALADLLALRLMMSAHANFPDEIPVLLTQDRDLAMSWAGLGATHAKTGENSFTYDLAPAETLFPGEFWERLGEALRGEEVVEETPLPEGEKVKAALAVP